MKRRWPVLLLAAALVLGLRAFAAGGTASDPLISLSYLTGDFLSGLTGAIAERVKGQTDAVFEAAKDELDSIGNSRLGADAGMEEWSYSAHYEPLTLKRGDTVTLYTGSGLLWTEGRGSAGAGLVSVTTAGEPAADEELTVRHSYLNGSEYAVTVTALSDTAQAAVEGYWVLTESAESVTPFTDLTQSKDWFYTAVRFAIDRGLFNGLTETSFSPQLTMNRAMLATVLHRMSGEGAEPYAGTFIDVADGEWYSAAVEWAGRAGVVTGYEDQSFRPAEPITREAIAVMLYRYAGGRIGLDVSLRGDLSAFPDGGDASEWAVEALQWAVGVGIITGTDAGMINPGSNATRAEVATMLQRLMNWAGTA